MAGHGADCPCIRCCDLASARAARRFDRQMEKAESQIASTLVNHPNEDVFYFRLDETNRIHAKPKGASTLDFTKFPDTINQSWITWNRIAEYPPLTEAKEVLYELRKQNHEVMLRELKARKGRS